MHPRLEGQKEGSKLLEPMGYGHRIQAGAAGDLSRARMMEERKLLPVTLSETEREGEKYPSFLLPLAWLPPTKCSLENEGPCDAETHGLREKKGSEG